MYSIKDVAQIRQFLQPRKYNTLEIKSHGTSRNIMVECGVFHFEMIQRKADGRILSWRNSSNLQNLIVSY